MESFENRLKKVRKICAIFSIAVAVLIIGFTFFKVGLLNYVVNNGVDYLIEQNQLQNGDPISGIIGVGGVVVGGIGVVFFWLKAIFLVLLIDGLIWIGFLIYYLTNKEKLKKNPEIDVKIE